MRNKIYVVLICSIGAVNMNCGLESDPIECPPNFTGSLSETEIKLTGQWELTGINSDVDVDITNDNVENPSKDLYAQNADCDKDADYEFKTDRTYGFSLGQNAANCSNKSISNGTWKLTVDQLSLVTNCNTMTNKIVFNDGQTEFSFANELNIRDVKGTTSLAKITFVYSKVE